MIISFAKFKIEKILCIKRSRSFDIIILFRQLLGKEASLLACLDELEELCQKVFLNALNVLASKLMEKVRQIIYNHCTQGYSDCMTSLLKMSAFSAYSQNKYIDVGVHFCFPPITIYVVKMYKYMYMY